MNTHQILSNLLFSFNNIIPVFLIILIGFFLKRSILTQQFSQSSNKLVFNIALPALIFNSIYTADLRTVFDIKIILFSVSGTLILFSIVSIFSYFLIPEKKSIGSFVQGSFRSNFIIIGIPIIKNLLGPEALIKSAIIISFILPLYNILAVLILSVSSLEKTKVTASKVINDIIKNPLILSVLVALPFVIFNVKMPPFFSKALDYLSDIAIPLALLDIGSSIHFKCFFSTLRLALTASIIKIAISPIIFVIAAYFLKFRGADLGILFILFASPTAVSSFIMAKGMKNNADLAANIVLLTTIGSIFTIFIGVFILRSMGLLK